MALAVLALVAVVALFDTLPAVLIVLSLSSVMLPASFAFVTALLSIV